MSASDTSFGTSRSDFVITTPDCLKDVTSRLKSQKSAPRLSRTMWACFKLLARLKIGTVHLTTPDGRTVTFAGDREGQEGYVTINRDRAVRRFLIGGHLGWCESYLDGDWDSPDIATFFEVILANAGEMRKTFSGKKLPRFMSWLIHKTHFNSIKGSKKNIYAHYDIGNDFYAHWLDSSMTYSAALFKDGNETLEKAQENKYRAMADAMHLEPGMSVLEIGCGWGGFAEFLGKNFDVNVTSITISNAQYDYAVKRIKDAGLEHKVTIKLEDYRTIAGRYDRIGSIEMFEAVGEKYWPVYFEKMRELLKPSGKAIVQTITIGNEHFESYRKSADYIQRYIFPGGMLPSPYALNKHIRNAGLRPEKPLSFGQDYAKTLQIWNENFQRIWPKLANKGFDGRFKRLWELYLCYCDAGFRDGTTDVIQIPIRKD